MGGKSKEALCSYSCISMCQPAFIALLQLDAVYFPLISEQLFLPYTKKDSHPYSTEPLNQMKWID